MKWAAFIKTWLSWIESYFRWSLLDGGCPQETIAPAWLQQANADAEGAESARDAVAEKQE